MEGSSKSANSDEALFDNAVIRKLTLDSAQDEKIKISNDAVELLSLLAKAFVEECALRSVHQATKIEDVAFVTPEHLNKILAQLLFDFD